MNQDPVFEALNGLVRSGELTEQHAQAAYDAARGNPPQPNTSRGAPASASPASANAYGWERISLDAIAATLGVGLLLTVLAISVFRSRDSGDLDWSVFSLGVLATVGLIGVAAASWRLVGDPDQRRHLISWPGAAGALGAGLMVAVAMDGGDLSGYLVGAVVVALSTAGYWLVRSNPFVLTGIMGLAILYVQILDDISGVGDLLDGDNPGIWVGLIMLIFGVLVTGIGWLLPTRVFSALVVGGAVLFNYISLLIGLFVAQSFLAAFSESFASSDGAADDAANLNNDAWMLLAFTAVMIAGWVWCYLRTGHVGFRVLIVGALAMVPVLVTVVLMVEHPTWWEAAFGVAGGGALVTLLAKATGRLGGPGGGSGVNPVGGYPMPGQPASGPAEHFNSSSPVGPASAPPYAPTAESISHGGSNSPYGSGPGYAGGEPTQIPGRRADGPADPPQTADPEQPGDPGHAEGPDQPSSSA